jgi:NTE family protein
VKEAVIMSIMDTDQNSKVSSRSEAETKSRPSRGKTAPSGRQQIALALQGGGSHGAFTWGVLDRLLEEPSLEIVAVSGTSAGAMNAGVLAHGLRGGRAAAREALRGFWEALGRTPGFASLQGFWMQASREWHLENSPFFQWFNFLTQMLSPYQFNPFNIHPLRPLIEHIDFAALRRDPAAIRLFIGATNVRTGRRRVFDNRELSPDVLLASACLPLMFQAVEIDGESYWDGGYTGNPAIAPLYQETAATDLIIVGINPLSRDTLPRTAREIDNRIDEISFNSSFMLELSAIAFIDQLLDDKEIDPDRFRPLLLHGIDGGAKLGKLGASSKVNNHPAFLRYLHGYGREAADVWLDRHRHEVGKESTVDLARLVPLRQDYHVGLVTCLGDA